jgi:hypothetical protein
MDSNFTQLLFLDRNFVEFPGFHSSESSVGISLKFFRTQSLGSQISRIVDPKFRQFPPKLQVDNHFKAFFGKNQNFETSG